MQNTTFGCSRRQRRFEVLTLLASSVESLDAFDKARTEPEQDLTQTRKVQTLGGEISRTRDTARALAWKYVRYHCNLYGVQDGYR
jgi:hypothetical protein